MVYSALSWSILHFHGLFCVDWFAMVLLRFTLIVHTYPAVSWFTLHLHCYPALLWFFLCLHCLLFVVKVVQYCHNYPYIVMIYPRFAWLNMIFHSLICICHDLPRIETV